MEPSFCEHHRGGGGPWDHRGHPGWNRQPWNMFWARERPFYFDRFSGRERGFGGRGRGHHHAHGHHHPYARQPQFPMGFNGPMPAAPPTDRVCPHCEHWQSFFEYGPWERRAHYGGGNHDGEHHHRSDHHHGGRHRQERTDRHSEPRHGHHSEERGSCSNCSSGQRTRRQSDSSQGAPRVIVID